MPILGEVEKIYQAVLPQTQKNEGDGSFFQTDYNRKYFVGKLTDAKIAEAITYLQDPKNAGVSQNREMLATLERVKTGLATIQGSASKDMSALLATTVAPVVAPPAVAAPAPVAPVAAPPAVAAPVDQLQVAKEKINTLIKSVKVPEGYKLTIDETDKLKPKVYLTGAAGKRYFTIGNPENKDKEDQAGLQKWVDTMKKSIEGGGSAVVASLPDGYEKPKKYPNTVIKSGTAEDDYAKGDSYIEAGDDENIFPAYGYKWKTDGEKDFSVEKIKETLNTIRYTVGGPNPPPGLSVTKVVTTGAGGTEETKVYFSKALKSAGAGATGEARNVIALEDDGGIDQDFETVNIDGTIYDVEMKGLTIEFKRDSAATQELKDKNKDKQDFLNEVKKTVITVDGLPVVNSIRGLTVDKDGYVRAPFPHKGIDGADISSFSLGDKDTWQEDNSWEYGIIIKGVAYTASITWTSDNPVLTFTKDEAKTKEYKEGQDKSIIEKNSAFVAKHTKALDACVTGDKCTADQKPLVAAAIAPDAPLDAVRALQKAMKLSPPTGVWDARLLNALMHQKK